MLKSVVVFAVFAVLLVASLPLDFEDDSDRVSEVHHRVKRKSNALTDIERRWPNRTVPYRVNAKGFSKKTIEKLKFSCSNVGL
jgi:hypothetical protein